MHRIITNPKHHNQHGCHSVVVTIHSWAGCSKAPSPTHRGHRSSGCRGTGSAKCGEGPGSSFTSRSPGQAAGAEWDEIFNELGSSMNESLEKFLKETAEAGHAGGSLAKLLGVSGAWHLGNGTEAPSWAQFIQLPPLLTTHPSHPSRPSHLESIRTWTLHLSLVVAFGMSQLCNSPSSAPSKGCSLAAQYPMAAPFELS